MNPATLRRGRPSTVARAGAILGLLIYCLPFAAAVPRPARGGSADRASGMVVARCRQVQADVAADGRPPASPSAPALAPARTPAVLAPDPAGCSTVDVWDAVASPPIPGTRSRSPPVS